MNAPAVTVLATLPPIKGLSAYTKQLLTALLREGPVDFIGFRRIYPRALFRGGSPFEEGDALFTTLEHPGLRTWERLSWANPLTWLQAGMRIRTPVLHVHWWTSALFPVLATVMVVARLRGIRIVCTVHNVVGHESGPLDRLLSRVAIRLAHRWIVHSAANRAQLVRRTGTPADRVTVVPHGTYGFYLTGAVDRATARRGLGVGNATVVYLYFGHIRRYKGIGVLLDAFRRLLDHDPDAFLVLAGQPWGDWPEIERAFADDALLDRRVVRHLDFVPSSQVEQYFAAADALVLPYLEFESQSGPGSIALAAGLPVIASRVGGLPDLVVDERLLVEPGDAAGLARALAVVAADPGLPEARAATRALAAHSGWAECAELTRKVYRAAENRT